MQVDVVILYVNGIYKQKDRSQRYICSAVDKIQGVVHNIGRWFC